MAYGDSGCFRIASAQLDLLPSFVRNQLIMPVMGSNVWSRIASAPYFNVGLVTPLQLNSASAPTELLKNCSGLQTFQPGNDPAARDYRPALRLPLHRFVVPLLRCYPCNGLRDRVQPAGI